MGSITRSALEAESGEFSGSISAAQLASFIEEYSETEPAPPPEPEPVEVRYDLGSRSLAVELVDCGVSGELAAECVVDLVTLRVEWALRSGIPCGFVAFRRRLQTQFEEGSDGWVRRQW